MKEESQEGARSRDPWGEVSQRMSRKWPAGVGAAGKLGLAFGRGGCVLTDAVASRSGEQERGSQVGRRKSR